MKKSTAHIIFVFFDVSAFILLYVTYLEYKDITRQIITAADIIIVNAPFGMFLITLNAPLIHGLSLVNWGDNAKKFINAVFVGFFVLSIITVYLTNSFIDNKLTTNNYQFCEAKSESMRFVKFKAYIKSGLLCE